MNRGQILGCDVWSPWSPDMLWIQTFHENSRLGSIKKSSRIPVWISGFLTKREDFCGFQTPIRNPSEYLPLKGEMAMPALTLGDPSSPWSSILPGHFSHQHCSINMEAIMPAPTSTQIPPDPYDGPLKILALDLGTTTGWALRGFDSMITSGTVSFKPGRYDGGGMRYLRFTNWLTEIDRLSGPIEAIYFEEVRRHLGTDAAHVYGGLMASLTSWAELRGIPYQGVSVGTIKKHATGKGNANKLVMIDAVRARGFTPTDDNEADAIALLLWAIETRGGVV